MAANWEYRFHYVAANSSASVFIHGYRDNEAVAYSARVYGLSAPGVLYPKAHATLTQGETLRHVDGTTARMLYVRNHASFNPCTLDVLILRQTF